MLQANFYIFLLAQWSKKTKLNFAQLDIYRENYYVHISTLWFA